MAPVVEGGLVVGVGLVDEAAVVVGVALVVELAVVCTVVAAEGGGEGEVVAVSVPHPAANTAARAIVARRMGRTGRVVVVIRPQSTHRQATASPNRASHPGEIHPSPPDRSAVFAGRERVPMLSVWPRRRAEMTGTRSSIPSPGGHTMALTPFTHAAVTRSLRDAVPCVGPAIWFPPRAIPRCAVGDR